MKYTAERIFCNTYVTLLGWTYKNFDDVLEKLLYDIVNKIGHPIIGGQYYYLKFFMNTRLYNEFSFSCKVAGHDPNMYRGIRIILDPALYVGDSKSPEGIVRLIYEEPEVEYIKHDARATYDFWTTQVKTKPHIDHVRFNGPATIVFWKDGTKTVVKYDGKGRKDKKQAILYAFIRKIYGEGKPYHNILNEIEEAVK